MHVDSWWDSYLEHGGTPKPLCIYIYSDVHTIRTSGLESFLLIYSAGQLQYSKYIIYTQDFPKCT